MATFTVADLKTIVGACGVDAEEAAALDDPSALDTAFDDLGFDSLLVYEIVTRIQDGFPVLVPDEELDGIGTPAALIGYVNERLTTA
ncbi:MULTISPECIES: acyl carrier protein [Streptomyces]|uniref:acyl carrier protein n=1 Tax=Streptomyces TaxID=1883 RepID=UPI0013713D52|nr:phosphopantetheine-binding protein [Streptomyces sp. SID2888]MYV50224.1 acyl carrier protein [Streptomyces sp. SID2888]